MKQIVITDIPGFSIGQVEDEAAATGATVIMCEQGMAAGIDIRGGGPASRDTRILDPLAAAEEIHAVLIAGGSAFGLDAAGGVQRYLEERGVGFILGGICIPLVCQSDILDLMVGDPSVRPDAQMGYDACVAAEQGNYRDGNYGAGCGATVGKMHGMGRAMKSGMGSYAVQAGELMVGAIAVVNALGDVVDPAMGTQVAGLRSDDGRMLASSEDALIELFEAGLPIGTPNVVGNTTIAAILTNAALPKAALCKVASMAHDGMARAIRPVHTSADGDTVYTLSCGDADAPADVVGALAATVLEQAILVAARSAEPAYGLPSAKELC